MRVVKASLSLVAVSSGVYSARAVARTVTSPVSRGRPAKVTTALPPGARAASGSGHTKPVGTSRQPTTPSMLMASKAPTGTITLNPPLSSRAAPMFCTVNAHSERSRTTGNEGAVVAATARSGPRRRTETDSDSLAAPLAERTSTRRGPVAGPLLARRVTAATALPPLATSGRVHSMSGPRVEQPEPGSDTEASSIPSGGENEATAPAGIEPPTTARIVTATARSSVKGPAGASGLNVMAKAGSETSMVWWARSLLVTGSGPVSLPV